MRITAMAATAAVLALAGGGAALACEGPGPCAYAPASDAYVFQPPGGPGPMIGQMTGPMMHPGARYGRPTAAYIVSPGPTPAYAAEGYAQSGGEYRGAQSYGEVRPVDAYIAPYTPAFGRNVVAERPYTGPGYGYTVEAGACGHGCGPAGMQGPPHGYLSPCADACDHGPVARIEKRVYVEREYAEAQPVRIPTDFFYGGLTGGAGYGVDGGYVGGGGGGVFIDNGFGFAGTRGFSSAFAGASARASASAFAFSYGGKGKMHGGKGGGCYSCGGHGGKH